MMKRTLRIACVIFLLILCISLCTINAFAEPDDGGDATSSQSQIVTTETPTTQPATEPPTRATTQPPATQPPVTKPPATKAPVTNPPATQAPTQAPQYNSSSQSSYVSNNSNYYSSKSSALSSPTKAPTSPVYNVDDRKVDTDTLKKKDWKRIAEELNNADADDGSVDDFGFIKNNDDDGDNGMWILYTGIALEVAAAIIIITLIVRSVRRKRQLKNGNGRGGNHREPPRGGRPAPQRASVGGPAPRRAPSPARAQQPPTRRQQRQVKERSKYDTDEVYIPKNANGRGARHYKPRH